MTRNPKGPAEEQAGIRPGVKLVAVVVIVGVGLLAFLFRGGRGGDEVAVPRQSLTRPGSPGDPGSPGGASGDGSGTLPKPRLASEGRAPSPEPEGPPPEAAPALDPLPNLAAILAGLPPATAETRDLVKGLSRMEQAGRAMTREEVAAWKEDFRKLVEGGAGSVSAIREFLQQNTEVDFTGRLKDSLGFSSARSAMIDALLQIGGPEGIAVSLQALQTAGEPREVGQLARNLEALAPEQFRHEAVQAARQVLDMARSGAMPGRDVGPAFEVLYRFGDPAVIPELEDAARQWKYYSAIALAGLPEGAGVPTLIRQAAGEAQGGIGARDPALRMLATVAPQNAEARAALVAAAQADRIPAVSWHGMANLLAGDQISVSATAYETPTRPGVRTESTSTHVSLGNQNFRTLSPPGGLSPEQVAQQTALINELAAVTTNPQGVAALQRARELLARRQAPEPPSNP